MASRVACVTAVVALAAATTVVDGRRVTPLAESEPFPSSLPQSEPGSFSAASHDRWSSGKSDLPSGERFPSSMPQSEPTSSAGHWHFSSDVPSGERFPSSLPQSEPASSQGGEGWSSELPPHTSLGAPGSSDHMPEPHEQLPEIPDSESGASDRGAAKDQWAVGLTKKQAVLAGVAVAVFFTVAVVAAVAALITCCCCRKANQNHTDVEAACDDDDVQLTTASLEPFPSVEKVRKEAWVAPIDGQDQFDPVFVVVGSPLSSALVVDGATQPVVKEVDVPVKPTAEEMRVINATHEYRI